MLESNGGVIATILGTCVTGFIVYYLYIQVESLRKINSGKEIEQFRKYIEDNDQLRFDIHEMMKDPKCMNFSEDRLKHLLNSFEVFALKWKDDIITSCHMYEIFGLELKAIKECPEIMNHIKDTITGEYPLYNRLYELLCKNENWYKKHPCKF